MIDLAQYRKAIEDILGHFKAADGIGHMIKWEDGSLHRLSCSERDWSEGVIPKLDALAKGISSQIQEYLEEKRGWGKPYTSGGIAYYLPYEMEPKVRLLSVVLLLLPWLEWQFRTHSDPTLSENKCWEMIRQAWEAGNTWGR